MCQCKASASHLWGSLWHSRAACPAQRHHEVAPHRCAAANLGVIHELLSSFELFVLYMPVFYDLFIGATLPCPKLRATLWRVDFAVWLHAPGVASCHARDMKSPMPKSGAATTTAADDARATRPATPALTPAGGRRRAASRGRPFGPERPELVAAANSRANARIKLGLGVAQRSVSRENGVDTRGPPKPTLHDMDPVAQAFRWRALQGAPEE